MARVEIAAQRSRRIVEANTFLQRLEKIHEKRERFEGWLTESENRPLRLAEYSLYIDCVRLGRRTEARQILGLPNIGFKEQKAA